jgi:hypothetical protein
MTSEKPGTSIPSGKSFKHDMAKILICSCLLFVSFYSLSQEILVAPYIQPGNASSLSNEEKVVIWQTDSVPGSFHVYYTQGTFAESKKISNAKISVTELYLNRKTTFLYRARLPKLQFDNRYSYRVSLSNKTIAENWFYTRTKKSQTRFVVFGDGGQGTPQQAAIAYQVYQQKPQFVLITGDNVYSNGLENEYRKNFFPYYIASEASIDVGAPLMNTIPFYLLPGNHDVRSADFNKFPDGLAYFYYNDLPLNGPRQELTLTPVGDKDVVKAFKKNAGPRFPRMVNYSFDHGNVHIACLDANDYVNPVNAELIAWLKEDLNGSKADWKIVAFHHPGFNSSKAHYDYQIMRLLSPVLENLNVDLVLNGHVHNYQRSLPLKFSPKQNEEGTQYIVSPEGRVDGVFTLDKEYDGINNTRPNGIIYIVTGAGGAGLYDKALSNNPDLWTHSPNENWVPFTVKMISDRHSFTLIETEAKRLTLKQLDTQGEIIDSITIIK